MTRSGKIRSLAAAALAALSLLGGPARSADERSDEDVKRDLLAVITLDGHPCGAVVGVQRLGQDDYLATCRSGDRYRVRIVSGRVSVEKP
jgi:hypothetical protein